MLLLSFKDGKKKGGETISRACRLIYWTRPLDALSSRDDGASSLVSAVDWLTCLNLIIHTLDSYYCTCVFYLLVHIYIVHVFYDTKDAPPTLSSSVAGYRFFSFYYKQHFGGGVGLSTYSAMLWTHARNICSVDAFMRSGKDGQKPLLVGDSDRFPQARLNHCNGLNSSWVWCVCPRISMCRPECVCVGPKISVFLLFSWADMYSPPFVSNCLQPHTSFVFLRRKKKHWNSTTGDP